MTPIIKLENGIYNIKFIDDSTKRYLEWNIPDIIFFEIIKWFRKKKDFVIVNEETDLCEFSLKLSYLEIKRKDIYSLIGYVLPVEILNFILGSYFVDE